MKTMNNHMKLVPVFSTAFPLFSIAFTLTMCVYKYLLKILDVGTGQCCKCLLNTPYVNCKHSSSGIQHIPRFCYPINKNKHFFCVKGKLLHRLPIPVSAETASQVINPFGLPKAQFLLFSKCHSYQKPSCGQKGRSIICHFEECDFI